MHPMVRIRPALGHTVFLHTITCQAIILTNVEYGYNLIFVVVENENII